MKDVIVNTLTSAEDTNPFLTELRKGFFANTDTDCCIFKKCCKKYKKGKRCKKCPDR